MSPARAVRRSLDPECGAVRLPGLSGLGQDCAAPPHPGPSSADPPPHIRVLPLPRGPQDPGSTPRVLTLRAPEPATPKAPLAGRGTGLTSPYRSGDPAALVFPGLSFPTWLKVEMCGLTTAAAFWSCHQMVPGLGADSGLLGRAVNPESGSWGWPRGCLDAGGPRRRSEELSLRSSPPGLLLCPLSGSGCPAAPCGRPFPPSPHLCAGPSATVTPLPLAVTLLMEFRWMWHLRPPLLVGFSFPQTLLLSHSPCG